MEYKLLVPIKEGTKEITTITVQEPTVGDLEVMDNHTGDVAKSKALISRVCGLSESAVTKMVVRDMTAISKILEPFLE